MDVLRAGLTWWHGATIYQIYPRSFQDSNGDGIGDLPGILSRLDYIASLGVDAIWISPFFRSPQADFGYDIADYRAVDPMFGTLADFDRIIHRAHELGIRVMIDQVLSHTSIEHAWFQESRQSRDNPKADWYVWADPREDGTPPNNWLAIFGGVAWQWEPRRAQYYLHNFLVDQPDLNFHNPEVQEAALANIRFWLERGVDGLRLDAINFCFHDRQLRNNPPKSLEKRTGRGVRVDNPYAYQVHQFDNTQPENLALLEKIRALTDEFPGAVTLGEISSEDSNATIAEYTAPGRLHMAYSFELLGTERRTTHVADTVNKLFAAAPGIWPCWAVSNHDVERVVSRWGGPNAPAHYGPLITALLTSLRGAVCIYQGEELGLTEADVPYEDLQDPYGITFWPVFKGRDGCRTPMPWTSASDGGFSQGKPWLPLSAAHLPAAVAQQDLNPASTLNVLRHFLKWRKQQAALRLGSLSIWHAQDPYLVLTREHTEQHLVVAFNVGDQSLTLSDDRLVGAKTLLEHGLPSGELTGNTLVLPPYSVWFGEKQ